MPIRYYVHGDAHESSPEKYYCAFCDLFESREHFSGASHTGDHQDRYGHSLKGWNELNKKRPEKYQRPATAENLFALLPKKPKPKTGRFYRWLKRQEGRDDPIGDLAGDVEADGAYPRASDSIKALRSHLVQKRACSEALQALAEAWDEFKSNDRNRSGISIKVRFEVFRSDDYRCRICGASAQDGVRLEVDHKVPVSKGGSDELQNLWTLCFKCNRGKGASDL
jgi:uncharacterized protein YozE (UPF0346 family)